MAPEALVLGVLGQREFVCGVAVQDVQRAGQSREGALDVVQELAEDGLRERVIEEEEAWTVRDVERCRILTDGTDGHGGGLSTSPEFKIGLRGLDQAWVEFNPEDLAEGKLGGEHKRATFAAADVDECILG